jgi:nucleotide-binding universal stress UspA family protein
MFKKILAPVDLRHLDHLGKALDVAAALAKDNKAELIYVAVTTTAPSEFAHNPAEFEKVLADFAAKSGAEHGVATQAKAVFSHDPTSDLDDTLLRTAEEVGADLIVMASHIPNVADHIWPSNGGTICSHAPVSVFVVR